jgi:hypothetical protein
VSPTWPSFIVQLGGPAIPASGTYYWGDLVRMDVLAAPSSTWLAFYSPSTLRVRGEPLLKVWCEGVRKEEAGSDKAALGGRVGLCW